MEEAEICPYCKGLVGFDYPDHDYCYDFAVGEEALI